MITEGARPKRHAYLKMARVDIYKGTAPKPMQERVLQCVPKVPQEIGVTRDADQLDWAAPMNFNLIYIPHWRIRRYDDCGIALETEFGQPAKEFPHCLTVGVGFLGRTHDLQPEYSMAELLESQQILEEPSPVPATLEVLRQSGVGKYDKYNRVLLALDKK